LSETRFLETHVAFEGASTQQRQILAALSQPKGPAPESVLSIGCGSGILDVPLARRLSARGPLRYVGLDPNPSHCRIFRRELRAHGVEGDAIASDFETHETPARFDLVLMVHTHYYLRDVPRELARAAALLRPNGRLVLAAAPREALNRLAQLFWPDRPEAELWFSEELEALFERAGVEAPAHRIEGRLDVTPCFRGTELGVAIRDFVAQVDTRALSDRLVAHIDETLRAMSRKEADGRWTAPHPVDLYELDASAAGPLRRAAAGDGAGQRPKKIIATR